MIDSDRFWTALDELASSSNLVVDRPAGSTRPRHPALTYPLDYGYLERTLAGDGCGIDLWAGSHPRRRETCVLCTVDREKRDVEVKLLLGCTEAEAQAALAVHSSGAQAGLLVQRQAR